MPLKVDPMVSPLTEDYLSKKLDDLQIHSRFCVLTFKVQDVVVGNKIEKHFQLVQSNLVREFFRKIFYFFAGLDYQSGIKSGFKNLITDNKDILQDSQDGINKHLENIKNIAKEAGIVLSHEDINQWRDLNNPDKLTIKTPVSSVVLDPSSSTEIPVLNLDSQQRASVVVNQGEVLQPLGLESLSCVLPIGEQTRPTQNPDVIDVSSDESTFIEIDTDEIVRKLIPDGARKIDQTEGDIALPFDSVAHLDEILAIQRGETLLHRLNLKRN